MLCLVLFLLYVLTLFISYLIVSLSLSFLSLLFFSTDAEEAKVLLSSLDGPDSH